MSNGANLNWIAGAIWSIADDVLRDVYVRGKYRDVILPMTVLRRLDAVLEPTKQEVLSTKAFLDEHDIGSQDGPLREAAGQAFYNTSEFTLHHLRAKAGRQQLKADFETYLNGFSPNVQDILDNFEFRNQLPRLSKADALGALIEKFTSPAINLSPNPVVDPDGTGCANPGLDNHGMGTGGMLTVAEDVLQQIAREQGKTVSTHLYGQEINGETTAICKADLLLKGEGNAADNIKGGPEHSTLSNDGFPSWEFDFMLSNPPYGKSWETDLQRMGGKKELKDPRFVIQHGGDPQYSLVTRSSDGQMLFLVNKLAKMKQGAKLGSRIAQVHNGSSLFTGSAGQRESNIRRWIMENDWLEAIVALPLNIFYNTGIATYVWVLTNRKPQHRRGKVQLIDASARFQPLRKNLGKKNCELGEQDIETICRTFLDFQETEQSRIFDNAAFGYWKVTVERPLRLAVDWSEERREPFFNACIKAGEAPLADTVQDVLDPLGPGPHRDFNGFLDGVKGEMQRRGLKMTARRKTLLQTRLAQRDARAAPVVRKVHRRGTTADPLHGLFAVGPGGRVVEVEPDSELRDTEQIPLQEEGGVEGFLQREVLPYAPDAWFIPETVKIGYEISFNRYFYKPRPMQTLEEIQADILQVKQETEGLMHDILGMVGG